MSASVVTRFFAAAFAAAGICFSCFVHVLAGDLSSSFDLAHRLHASILDPLCCRRRPKAPFLESAFILSPLLPSCLAGSLSSPIAVETVPWQPEAAEGEMGALETGVEQAGSLRRSDFRIVGSTCPACLRRISRALKESPGVLRSDVSIYRPYRSFVIYDSRQTSLSKLAGMLGGERVSFAEVYDRAILSLPDFVVPVFW